jgi:tetratricopeptide (TPR) repeat protein
LARADVEALEAELRQRDLREAIVLSARAALRAVPSLAFLLGRNRMFRRDSTVAILSVFRALQCSWLTAADTSPLNGEWIHNAAAAAEGHARSVGTEGRIALFIPAYAAYAAGGNNTPYTAAVAISDAPSANSVAAYSTAFPRGRQQTADRIGQRTAQASEADDAALRSGVSPSTLARLPLWPPKAKELAWTRNAWGWLTDALHEQGENWQVWTDWYDARLEGRLINESLEFGRAAIPNDHWAKGPRFINAEIIDLIAKNAHEAPFNIQKAETLRDVGAFEDALKAYEEVIRRFPQNVVARNGRAETLLATGQLTAALSASEETLRSFPHDLAARNGYARVLREMGRLDEALLAYLETIRIFPADVVAYLRRAEVLRTRGDLQGAFDAYEDIIRQFPPTIRL